MDARKKRALLARIEGQLALMDTDSATPCERRWRRIGWAISALGGLAMDDREARNFARLKQLVGALLVDTQECLSPQLLSHRRTLARAECIVLQMYVRHGRTRKCDTG